MPQPTIGVVIPVKDFDASSLSLLSALARKAPQLKFIAVGRVQTPVSESSNLRVVDLQCSIYEAMNVGTEKSTSDYLLYMGIDDRLLFENVDAVLNQLSTIDASLIVLPFMVGRRLVLQAPRTGLASFHHQGLLFNRHAVRKLGSYSTSYRLHSDLDLMFKVQKVGTVAAVSLPLVSFSKGGVTTTGRYALISMREITAIYRHNKVSRWCFEYAYSIALLCWYYARWLVVGLKK
jgi:hypothetical protein